MIYTMFTENYKESETELIKIFNELFEKQSDIGREYFKGNWIVMTQTITTYLASKQNSDIFYDILDVKDIKDNKKINVIRITKETIKINININTIKNRKNIEDKVKKDIIIVLEEFFNEHKDNYIGKDIFVNELFTTFKDWLNIKNYKTSINLKKIISILRINYKLKINILKDSEMKQVISFPDYNNLPTKIINPLSNWLFDYFKIDDNKQIKIIDVYAKYLETTNDNPKLSQNVFGKFMRELGYKSHPKNSIRYYYNISLK